MKLSKINKTDMESKVDSALVSLLPRLQAVGKVSRKQGSAARPRADEEPLLMNVTLGNACLLVGESLVSKLTGAHTNGGVGKERVTRCQLTRDSLSRGSR